MNKMIVLLLVFTFALTACGSNAASPTPAPLVTPSGGEDLAFFVIVRQDGQEIPFYAQDYVDLPKTTLEAAGESYQGVSLGEFLIESEILGFQFIIIDTGTPELPALSYEQLLGGALLLVKDNGELLLVVPNIEKAGWPTGFRRIIVQ